jgi:hypothetical protein
MTHLRPQNGLDGHHDYVMRSLTEWSQTSTMDQTGFMGRGWSRTSVHRWPTILYPLLQFQCPDQALDNHPLVKEATDSQPYSITL